MFSLRMFHKHHFVRFHSDDELCLDKKCRLVIGILGLSRRLSLEEWENIVEVRPGVWRLAAEKGGPGA